MVLARGWDYLGKMVQNTIEQALSLSPLYTQIPKIYILLCVPYLMEPNMEEQDRRSKDAIAIWL